MATVVSVRWRKPIGRGRRASANPSVVRSIPIREKNFGNGVIGLNYNRWDICRDAIKKGKALGLPLYQFLKEPLIRRFGEAWYQELLDTVKELKAQGYL